MNNSVKKIIDIINGINQDLLKSDEHMTWTKYERVDDLKRDLSKLIKRLEKNDLTALEDIELFFAPTGVLQEVSINGMWGLEFIEIGNDVDQLIKSIREKKQNS